MKDLTSQINEVKSFWLKIDENEIKVLSYMLLRQKKLESDLVRVAEYYRKITKNTLPFDELNVLRQKIRDYTVDIPKTSYQALLMGYISDHRRVKTKHALLCEYLMIYTDYQHQIVKRFTVVVEKAVKMAYPQTRYVFDPSATIPLYSMSLYDSLAVNAEYYMRRLVEETERERVYEYTLGGREYRDILTKARKDMLAQSVKTGNLYGVLDKYFVYAIGEKRIEELRQNNAEKVRFIAVLDNTTTDECRGLHGKVFKVSDLVVGKNAPPIYPPPHPCRSRLLPLK